MPPTTDTPAPAVGPHETVAERLQRVEQLLAGLRDPASIERQVTERVLASLHERANSSVGYGPPNGMATGENSGGIAGLVPAALMSSVVAHAAGQFAGQVTSTGFWSRLGIVGEFRLMVRMYFDARYRLSRVGQLGIPIIVVMMVLNYLLFAFWSLPLISLVFPILERLILVVLAFALYKLLSREAARYSEVLRYLASVGQG